MVDPKTNDRRLGRRGCRIVSLALGLIFGCSIAFGESFDQSNSIAPFAERGVASIIVLFALCVALAVAFELVFRFIEHVSSLRSKIDRKSIAGPKRALFELLDGDFSFVLVFVVLVIAWCPWLFSFYPGLTDADTISQLLQAAGMAHPSDHHPYFDSLIFSFFIQTGIQLGSSSYGLFAYACLQLAAAALGMSFALNRLKVWGCPRSVRLALFLFIAIVPLFPIMSLSMMKDSLFAVVFLPWFVLFADIVWSKGGRCSDMRVLAAFALFAFLCCMTKKTGVYVVAICSVVGLIWLMRGSRLRFASSVACGILPFLIWTQLILPSWNIPPGSSAEMLSVPSQQVARYASSYELTQEERDAIQRVFACTPEELAAGYDPRRSDYTKGFWIGGNTEDLADFAQAYLGMFSKHPGTFISATWNNIYDYFYPKKQIMFGTWPNFEDKYIVGAVPLCYEYVTEDQIRSYFNDLIVDMNDLQRDPPLARYVFVGVEQLPLVGILFTQALYCSWIPFILVGLSIRRKSMKLFICAIPCLVILLTLVAGPISLSRYMPASVYTAIVLAGLLFCSARDTSQEAVKKADGAASG